MLATEQPTLKERLLFKTADRLSGHKSVVNTPPPIQRRKTFTGQSAVRHQPQQPGSQRRASQQQAPPLVFAHLPPRTRCLTPPPKGKSSDLCPKPDEQIRSLLFKLPDDVLLMICKEVVGSRLIHIVRRRHNLGHTKCNTSGDPNECRKHQCRGVKLPTGTYVHAGQENGDLIPLLQTCRKIYVNAIEMLYSSNVFDFDSMEGYISISCGLLPKRFDSIQSIRMDFRFNLSLYFSETTCFNDWPRWERTWRVLASMGALQKLWLRISWPKEAIYDTEEKRYLEPLWILTHMEIFEVSLPPLKDVEKDWQKETPFQIIRRGSSDAEWHL